MHFYDYIANISVNHDIGKFFIKVVNPIKREWKKCVRVYIQRYTSRRFTLYIRQKKGIFVYVMSKIIFLYILSNLLSLFSFPWVKNEGKRFSFLKKISLRTRRKCKIVKHKLIESLLTNWNVLSPLIIATKFLC